MDRLDFQGIEDVEVVHLANMQNRTIITFDKDYGALIFKNQLIPAEGVIYLRLNEFEPEEPGQIIQNILSREEL